MSTGKGAALRARAATALLGGGSPMPVVAQAAVAPKTVAAAVSDAGAPACRALDPGQVDQANRDFEQCQYDQERVILFTNLMREHADQPDYLAQLVLRLKQAGGGLFDSMLGLPSGVFVKDAETGAYAPGHSEEERQAIVGALQAALAAGTISEQELRALAANSEEWADVAARLGVGQAGVTAQTRDTEAGLRGVKGEYDSAHADVLAKEQRLQQELASFGPALTDEQRAKFIQAFRNDPANAAAYQKEAEAAAALSTYLETNKSAVLDAAARDPAARAALYESLQALAASGQGVTALDFVVSIQQDPGSPLAQGFAEQFPDFDQEVTAAAMTSAASQLMVDNGGDAQSALAQIKQMVAPLQSLWRGKVGVDQMAEAWKALDQAAAGNYDGLKSLAQQWDGKPGPMRLLSGLGVVLGAAGAVSSAQQGQYLEAIKGFARAGEQGLDLLAGATRSLADAGKLAQFTEDGVKFASFAERLAPGLGLVANGTAFVLDMQAATRDGGNAGFAVAALGDALGVMGSALELFPLTAPAGALFDGIGAVVSAAGTLLGGLLEDGKLKDEERAYLEAAGVTGPMRDTLMQADREQVDQLLALGLSPEQLQQLAAQYPELVQSSHGFGPNLDGLRALQERLGLSGADLFKLLNSAGEGSVVLLRAFGNFAGAFPEVRYAQTTQELIVALQNLQQNAQDSGEPEQAAAYATAIAWLQSLPPPQRVILPGDSPGGH